MTLQLVKLVKALQLTLRHCDWHLHSTPVLMSTLHLGFKSAPERQDQST